MEEPMRRKPRVVARNRQSATRAEVPGGNPLRFDIDSRAICGLFRHLVRIDQIARLVLGRHYHDLGREVLELAEIVALDVLELELEHARLRPLALDPAL